MLNHLLDFLVADGHLERDDATNYASGASYTDAGLDPDTGSVLSSNTPDRLRAVPVLKRLREEIVDRKSGWHHWDHLERHFGVFKTRAGRRRRVDIIVTTHLEWPFALLSWTGGKVFNRLLRAYANQIQCSLSAHCLMRVPDGEFEPANILQIPNETHPNTPIPRTEEDVLRLLGIPWLPPHLRDV